MADLAAIATESKDPSDPGFNKPKLKAVARKSGRFSHGVRPFQGDKSGRSEYHHHSIAKQTPGGVAERLKAPVLKTGNGVSSFVGSNPTSTACTANQMTIRDIKP